MDGVRLLLPERVRIATTRSTDDPDRFGGAATPTRRGLGYWLGGAGDWPTGTRPTAFGHPGYGGPHGIADPEAGLALGLARTTLGGAPVLDIVRRVRDTLGVPY